MELFGKTETPPFFFFAVISFFANACAIIFLFFSSHSNRTDRSPSLDEFPKSIFSNYHPFLFVFSFHLA